MNILELTPSKLSGKLNSPPSKSISHRAIICAALSEGESKLQNALVSDDIEKTIEGMKVLGAEIIEIAEENSISKNYTINGGLNDRNCIIDCKESGSTIRFLIPISLSKHRKVKFLGSGRLSERPLDIYYQIFENQGIEYINENGKLPLEINGELKSGKYYLRGDISSQFISGLLFTLPLLEGNSSIEITTRLESEDYIYMTIDMLKKFNVEIKYHAGIFHIEGNQKYKASDICIEGDFSQGAFWMVAGTLGAQIELENMPINSNQGDRVIIELINSMGGNIISDGNKLCISQARTYGRKIDVSQCPDLVPILAVLAAVSKGNTEIINAGRLKLKESDRLEAITTELNKIGANIKAYDDRLYIEGVDRLNGGTVEGWNDHRIVMALAIASIVCENKLYIEGSEVVAKSYPTFWEDFKKLGGVVSERNMG